MSASLPRIKTHLHPQRQHPLCKRLRTEDWGGKERVYLDQLTMLAEKKKERNEEKGKLVTKVKKHKKIEVKLKCE